MFAKADAKDCTREYLLNLYRTGSTSTVYLLALTSSNQ